MHKAARLYMRKIVGVDFNALMPMPTPVTAILA